MWVWAAFQEKDRRNRIKRDEKEKKNHNTCRGGVEWKKAHETRGKPMKKYPGRSPFLNFHRRA